MNSKYSNQDLINATLEIYNKFKPSQTEEIYKNTKEKIIKKPQPLLLTKEVKNKSKIKKKQSLNKSQINKKISNTQRLRDYRKRKLVYNKTTLILNKIIKYENEKYLLLDKIKNSNLKIIKMKMPSL